LAGDAAGSSAQGSSTVAADRGAAAGGDDVGDAGEFTRDRRVCGLWTGGDDAGVSGSAHGSSAVAAGRACRAAGACVVSRARASSGMIPAPSAFVPLPGSGHRESGFVCVGCGQRDDAASDGGRALRTGGAAFTAGGGGALARSALAAGLFGSNRGGSVCFLT